MRHIPYLFLLFACQLMAADNDWGDDDWGSEEQQTALHGFLEAGVGKRSQQDSALPDENFTLSGLRARIETETYLSDIRLNAKLDLHADSLDHGLHSIIREATADFSINQNLDLKVGHQVLTWGTGDLVFLNDLFPKDWVAFFSGEDDQYLKIPATSFKLSAYGEKANLDLVWTPKFTSDNFINGERFSLFSPMAGQQVAAPEGTLIAIEPAKRFSNSEFAARLHGSSQVLNSGNTEWAVYAYHGFWKTPNSINSQNQAYFSRLNILGASLRTSIGKGIANTEIAWYNGEDDHGNRANIPNNQLRFLVGYERELMPKLTGAVQHYIEHIQSYSELAANDGNSIYRPDKNRRLWTLRLTYRAMQDNLILSWFSFYSPTDSDYYHRPSIKYRFNDELSLTLGANLFGGKQPHTFFGQFDSADNFYLRLRWNY